MLEVVTNYYKVKDFLLDSGAVLGAGVLNMIQTNKSIYQEHPILSLIGTFGALLLLGGRIVSIFYRIKLHIIENKIKARELKKLKEND